MRSPHPAPTLGLGVELDAFFREASRGRAATRRSSNQKAPRTGAVQELRARAGPAQLSEPGHLQGGRPRSSPISRIGFGPAAAPARAARARASVPGLREARSAVRPLAGPGQGARPGARGWALQARPSRERRLHRQRASPPPPWVASLFSADAEPWSLRGWRGAGCAMRQARAAL